jgi:hypothetical protein
MTPSRIAALAFCKGIREVFYMDPSPKAMFEASLLINGARSFLYKLDADAEAMALLDAAYEEVSRKFAEMMRTH